MARRVIPTRIRGIILAVFHDNPAKPILPWAQCGFGDTRMPNNRLLRDLNPGHPFIREGCRQRRGFWGLAPYVGDRCMHHNICNPATDYTYRDRRRASNWGGTGSRPEVTGN